MSEAIMPELAQALWDLLEPHTRTGIGRPRCDWCGYEWPGHQSHCAMGKALALIRPYVPNTRRGR